MQGFQSDNCEEIRDRLQGHPLTSLDAGTSLMNFCSEVKSNRQLDLVLHNANTVKRQ